MYIVFLFGVFSSKILAKISIYRRKNISTNKITCGKCFTYFLHENRVLNDCHGTRAGKKNIFK